MGEPLEDSSVDNGIDDANIGSDSDIGDVGDSEHDVDDNDEGGEECGLENDVEDNDDNLDDKEKEDMANGNTMHTLICTDYIISIYALYCNLQINLLYA